MGAILWGLKNLRMPGIRGTLSNEDPVKYISALNQDQDHAPIRFEEIENQFAEQAPIRFNKNGSVCYRFRSDCVSTGSKGCMEPIDFQRGFQNPEILCSFACKCKEIRCLKY